MLVRPGFEPATSRAVDRRSPNWANQAAVFVTVQCTNMHRTCNFHIKGLLSQQGLMNFIIFCRWSIILVLSVQHLVKKKSHIGLYSSVEKPLQVFQSAATLEVCTVHKVLNTCLKCWWILVWLWGYWINHHSKEFQSNAPNSCFFLSPRYCIVQ